MRIKRTFCKVFYVIYATRGAALICSSRLTLSVYLLLEAQGLVPTPKAGWNGFDMPYRLHDALGR